MKEKTKEKILIKVNEKSIFYKVKTFFRNLFYKNETTENIYVPEKKENGKQDFIESIKNIENEETKLLKLQEQYNKGEIKEEELTEEQVECLCKLYDKQIANLRKSIEKRKQEILQYRKKYQQ